MTNLKNITDRIQGWQDILDLTGTDPKTMQLRPGETDDELAYRQWKLIVKAYNEGTELDAGNINQPKWFAWGNIIKDEAKPSGFGLSYYAYVDCLSYPSVGVRLCFKDSKSAVDAFNKFIDIRERLTIR